MEAADNLCYVIWKEVKKLNKICFQLIVSPYLKLDT